MANENRPTDNKDEMSFVLGMGQYNRHKALGGPVTSLLLPDTTAPPQLPMHAHPGRLHRQKSHMQESARDKWYCGRSAGALESAVVAQERANHCKVLLVRAARPCVQRFSRCAVHARGMVVKNAVAFL